MGRLGEEVSQKIKSAVRAKLMELGIHMDNELPDYVMVLVANKKTQKQMEQDLQLFLGSSTIVFTTWLHNVLKRLEQVTVSSKGVRKKSDEKRSKSKRHLSESSELGDEDEANQPQKKLKSNDKTKNQIKEEVLSDDETSCEPVHSISVKREPESVIDDDNDYLNIRADIDTEELVGGNENSCELDLNHSPECQQPIETEVQSSTRRKEESLTLNKDKNNQDGLKDRKNKSSDRSKERVKITWDCDKNLNDEKTDASHREATSSVAQSSSRFQDKQRSRRKSSDQDSSSVDTDKSKSQVDTKESKSHLESTIRLREEDKSAKTREKIQWHSSDESGKRPVIYDARDIIKLKTNVGKRGADKMVSPERQDKNKEDESESEKKRKHLHSVSKLVVHERVLDKSGDVSLPSLVKVTPRPVRRPGIQANCNLILKAVADAEKSVATAKNTCKLKSPDRISKRNEFSGYVPPAKISVTLSNDCVSSTVEKQKDKGEMSYKDIKEEQDNVSIKTNEDGASLETIEIGEAFKSSESWPETLTTTQEVSSSSNTRADEIEPQFLITLGNYSSDLFNDVELDWDEGEITDKVSTTPRQILTEGIESDNEQTETAVGSKQPFNRSRLGPPPVVAAVRPLQKNVSERIAEIDGIAIDIDTTSANKVVQLKVPKRCKYWPNCTAGDKCLFHHPDVFCRAFPNCKFGDQCNYVHPQCKFDEKCLNLNCQYTHTYGFTRKAKVPLPLSLPRNEQCIYYPNCTNKLCRFQHPNKFCKFGFKCNNWGCEFDHSLTSLPSKDQLTWTPSKT